MEGYQVPAQIVHRKTDFDAEEADGCSWQAINVLKRMPLLCAPHTTGILPKMMKDIGRNFDALRNENRCCDTQAGGMRTFTVSDVRQRGNVL